VLAIPFTLILVGTLVWSGFKARRRNGGQLSFLAAFTNTFLVLLVFNLFDLLVLDVLLLIWWRPAFMLLPGTEGMSAYNDWRFHLIASSKGLAFAVVSSLLIALVISNQWKQRFQKLRIGQR
jgi:hypothetical protein